MSAGQLGARVMRLVDSPDGKQADIMLIEPNGDEHLVRCLCKQDGTMDIGGDGEGTRVTVQFPLTTSETIP